MSFFLTRTTNFSNKINSFFLTLRNLCAIELLFNICKANIMIIFDSLIVQFKKLLKSNKIKS